MRRQQFAHGEQIVKYERAFLLQFRIRRRAVTARLPLCLVATSIRCSRGAAAALPAAHPA